MFIYPRMQENTAKSEERSDWLRYPITSWENQRARSDKIPRRARIVVVSWPYCGNIVILKRALQLYNTEDHKIKTV